MANIKSQIKRNRQNEKARLRNKAVRSELRTRTKAAVAAAEAGADDVDERLRLAIKQIDKAAAKGVIHKNAAARQKSRLSTAPAGHRPARADHAGRAAAQPSQPGHQHLEDDLVGQIALTPEVEVGLGEQPHRLDHPLVTELAGLRPGLLGRERQALHAQELGCLLLGREFAGCRARGPARSGWSGWP